MQVQGNNFDCYGSSSVTSRQVVEQLLREKLRGGSLFSNIFCNLVQVLCHKTGNYKLFEISKPNDQQYHAKCSFLGGDRIQTVQLLCILRLLRIP
ncbi:hypothetical protein ZWY2020_045342 [Hordeum vulgare]|nr:hypothetical protein ZWY2020_045342 [Hordeum vulgare]